MEIKLFYRQKILLAFLEVFKGHVDSIDFMKLMFLYCQYYDKNYYTFFPHRFGCFSNCIYNDKRILTQKNILDDTSKFSLRKKLGILFQLKSEDRYSILQFAKQIGSIRGEELIRKTYLEYPEYSKRSEIKNKILGTEVIHPSEELTFNYGPEIYTIGYEGIEIDTYLNKLIKHDINILVDVRKNPNSMKFNFNEKALDKFLEKVQIQYVGIPDLGIPASLRKDLDSMASYNNLFDKYESDILPRYEDKISEIISFIDSGKKVAVTCFEKNHLMCHRYRLAQWINKKKGYGIVNI